jgi:hypothetical protein
MTSAPQACARLARLSMWFEAETVTGNGEVVLVDLHADLQGCRTACAGHGKE